MTYTTHFTPARLEDLPIFEDIRTRAFQPIFRSFRNILGKVIYERAQQPEDLEQEAMLRSLFESTSVWEVWAARLDDRIIGFLSIRYDRNQLVGEIGLNALDPEYGGQGLGTQMYEFAVEKMKEAGMKVATVATGGDPAHLPARKAYRNAGFDVEIPSVWMCMELE